MSVPKPLNEEAIFIEKEYGFDSLLIEDVWSAAQWYTRCIIELLASRQFISPIDVFNLENEAFGCCKPKEEEKK